MVTRRIERCIRLVWIRDLLVREASNRWLRSLPNHVSCHRPFLDLLEALTRPRRVSACENAIDYPSSAALSK